MQDQLNMNMSMSISEEELGQSNEDDVYLSKLDNIAIYLKHINSRIFECIHLSRKPASRNLLVTLVNNFDKCIEDYNTYYLRKRINRLLYFKIDPLAIQREENYFTQKLYFKERNVQERVYFIKFVYSKDQSNYYRMHVQIWKHDGQVVVTNQILSRYQKNLTNDLIDELREKGFVSHFQESCVILKSKRPNHKNPNKNTNQQLNLIDCIESRSESFLRQMASILSKEQVCPFCGKYLIYQSRVGLMMPPTIIISTLKQTGQGTREENRQQKYKILHQACSLKYMRSTNQRVQGH